MAMTVLPVLHIGGMQLFHSEFSDRSEKILPRLSQITKTIVYTYIGLTVFCTLSLWFLGMNSFDAICHAMTVVSTGGMSNYDNSIDHFNSFAIESVLIIFMIIGGAPFLLYIRAMKGDYRPLWVDDQMKSYYVFIFVLPFILSLYRWFADSVPLTTALRQTYFNFVSAATTTGFTTGNYDKWGTFAAVLIFAAIFVGGCTGSTAGGFKQFRLKAVYTLTFVQLYKQYRPHTIRLPTYNGKEIHIPVMLSVLTFLTLFFITFGLVALGLSATGMDFMTCVSSTAACMTNFGPGFGNIIHPEGTYAPLTDSAKWLLMFAMILGRLELITVYVLFIPSFWRR